MKKYISIPLTWMFCLSGISGMPQRYGNIPKVSAVAPCASFHLKSCLHSRENGFSYNGQSRSGLFSKGQQSSIKVVFYKGMDYHIAVCTENKTSACLVIKDARTGEVLYDNSRDNNTQEIQLSNTNTRNVIILVSIPGSDEGGKTDMVNGTEGICAGLLIEHKRSDKTGF